MTSFTAPAPVHVTHEFLDTALHSELLDWVASNEAAFQASSVQGRTGDAAVTGYDLRQRKSQRCALPDSLQSRFHDAIAGALPVIAPKIGLKVPEVYEFETEVVAHNDGDFFKRHVDTVVKSESGSSRFISAVYYFCNTPPAFTGGELRLHALSGKRTSDVTPQDNTLAVFPSFFPHEVLPISVPSSAFEDSRFNINCWIRVRKA